MAKRKVILSGECHKCHEPLQLATELDLPDVVVEKEVIKEVPVYKDPPQLNLAPLEKRSEEIMTELRKGLYGHTPPSPNLIKDWEECDNCKPGWQTIKDQLYSEARKGFILKPVEEVKPAPEASTTEKEPVTGTKTEEAKPFEWLFGRK